MRKLVLDTADNDIKDKCLSHFSYLFLYVTNYALLIQIAIYKESYNSYPFDSLYFGQSTDRVIPGFCLVASQSKFWTDHCCHSVSIQKSIL